MATDVVHHTDNEFRLICTVCNWHIYNNNYNCNWHVYNNNRSRAITITFCTLGDLLTAASAALSLTSAALSLTTDLQSFEKD